MINQFDTNNLRDLRIDIDRALQALTERYGVKFSLGSISYSGVEASGKLTMSVTSTSETGETIDLAVKNICETYRINMEKSGFKVVAYKRTARQYPFIIQHPDGRRYKYSQHSARQLMGSIEPQGVTA